MDVDRLIGIEDVADLLGVSTRTVYQRLRDQDWALVPRPRFPVRAGAATQWSRAAVDRWIRGETTLDTSGAKSPENAS